MKSFLRQFVYLIVDGQRPSTLDLYRINMSRFFNPRSPVNGAMVDARLPRPSMTFYAPSSEHRSGDLQFMLLGRDKVLATDQTGRASVYDAGRHALSSAPTLSRPKHRPVSVAIGDRHYVLDTTRTMGGAGEEEHCFEALAYEHVRGPDGLCYDDWRCHSLPTPPYRPADIGAYAVVGESDLWVSTEDEGTYSFDTARGVWAKKGDWMLPFHGLAHYVPQYKLWFGLSSKDNNLLCAFDLTAADRPQSPLVPRDVCEDLWPPKEWFPVTSSLVHLGSGRFCIARFFCDTGREPDDTPCMVLAVFTAVEVEPCGKAMKGVKHKSVCYSLGNNILHKWVL